MSIKTLCIYRFTLVLLINSCDNGSIRKKENRAPHAYIAASKFRREAMVLSTAPKYKKKELKIEKMKEKEYSTSYLAKKKERNEEANTYPMTRLILIKDFVRSADLYKALGFFFSVQIIISVISAGIANPKYAGAMNILALLIGGTVIGLAIKVINARQRNDASRRRVRISRALITVAMMFVGLIVVGMIFNALGITMAKQPNQMSLNVLLSQFPLAMIFTVVVVSPVVEELVFRELLPHATGPSYLSFIIASLIFIALHAPFGIMGWTSYAVLSAGFLYARLRDNNVYSGILVHMIWNALSVML